MEDPNERRLRDIKKLIMIGVSLEDINRMYPPTAGFGGHTKVTTPRQIVQYEAEHGEIDISDFGTMYGRIITGKDGIIRLSNATTSNTPAVASSPTMSSRGRKSIPTQRNNFVYGNYAEGGRRKSYRRRHRRRITHRRR